MSPNRCRIATATFVALFALATISGCPVTTATPTPNSCPPAENVQGCPLTDPGLTTGDGWCRDIFAPLFTHQGAATCYRGYGENDGAQCCYAVDGCLISDDGGAAAGTADIIGPASAENDCGLCAWFADPLRVLRHILVDVISPVVPLQSQ